MERTAKNKKIVIIDGNSLVNRAYYAIQRPMITKDGLYTQGIFGFLNMLEKVEKDYDPGYIVVAFDRKAPTFRHKEYADYKAGRKRMPPELAMQMPVLKEVLAALNIKMLEIDGFEADDILGTVAREAEEEGMEPLIFTGDKDALQLAGQVTKVILTKKGITELECYDEQAMIDKYGFTPNQFIDYKGLMGDPSDNIPGLPGVGEKTALKLILQFGTVAGLLARTEEIESPKLREKVEENAQLAAMSRRLAEIDTHVPLEIDFDEFLLEEPDYDALIDIYTKLQFNSFLKRLQKNKGDVRSETPEGVEVRDVLVLRPYAFAGELPGLQQLLTELERDSTCVLKVEHNNDHRDIPVIEGISILTKNTYYYLDGAQTDAFRDGLEARGITLRIHGHQIQEDYYALLCHGFRPSLFQTEFDTALGQYLLEPGRSSYELNVLLMEYLHCDLEGGQEKADVLASTPDQQLGFLTTEEPPDDTGKKAVQRQRWCLATEAVERCIAPRLEEEGMSRVFQEIELPLVVVLASMEQEGMAVDRPVLEEIGGKLKSELVELTQKIYGMAGEEFKINSPKQLGTILFDKLGLPTGKKTKSGYSTDADTLEKLKGEHEIIECILLFRTLSKLNSTYVEGLLPLIHKDGRIHAHFQPTVTTTGRISCTEPNLQNIPIRQEMGRLIRKAFVSDGPEWTLVGADYSQIELRVMAHMSGDENMIEAFREGADIHRSTAARVFGIAEKDVTHQQRSSAKAVNFGVIYGISSFGLATGLNISPKEAENYINEYFRKYEKVKLFMDELVVDCRAKGYAETIFGRRRPVPEITASNFQLRKLGERLAMNSPIQGSAADIIKIAMVRCSNALEKSGLRSRLILQIHDELIIKTHRDELEQVKKLLKDTMENAVEMKIPLAADLNCGDNWYELK